MSRHRAREFAPQIGMSELGAYLLGRMVEVVHADLSPEEKVAALRALADLAGDLSDYWEAQHPGQFGDRARTIWLRLAGLSRDGSPEHWEQRAARVSKGGGGDDHGV